MTPHAQLPMFQLDKAHPRVEEHEDEPKSGIWLGLFLDHRQLFDALEGEWVHPVEGTKGRILTVQAFPVPVSTALQKHRIGTYVEVDPKLLPPLDVHVLRGGKWSVLPINDVRNDDEAICWYGALPSTAITRVFVSNTEEQARLMRLARDISNVLLPGAVRLRSTEREWSKMDAKAPEDELSGIVLPPHFDAIRGATAMAVMEIPRIDPWLDMLVASLTLPPKDLSESSRIVEAPWWSFPPWIKVSTSAWPRDVQSRLWLAAIDVFRDFDRERGMSADEITQEIATRAIEGEGGGRDALNGWINETLSILRADDVIHLDDWKKCPVGKAIQLVLVRPEPAHFKTWTEDLPGVSPAVWWSAAVLCGLLHGYKRLDVKFRGGLNQRRFLANHALAVCERKWTERLFEESTLTWRRFADQFVFTLGSAHLWEKPQRARAKWFQADMSNDVVRAAAEDMARRLGWPCSNNVINAEQFRGCVAIEAGAHLPMPPRPEAIGVAMVRPLQSNDHVQRLPAVVEVPGLRCVENFLTDEQEAKLIKIIDDGEWMSDLTRRVQHYGWRYSYKDRAIDLSMKLGPLPDWARELAERLAHEGLVTHVADQVIVNEYVENQGISKHIDCTPCFTDGIAMISLLESWEMIFAEVRGGKRKCAQVLERRSVAVMTGDARYKWTHEIPKRKKEPSGIVRKRRISVTLRKVNESAMRKLRGEESGADDVETSQPTNG